MKTILMAATAAVALVGFAGGANAEHTTYSSTYAGTTKILGIPVQFEKSYDGAAAVLRDIAGPANTETRYHQDSSAPDNTETANAQASANQQTFKLTGTVQKDCSFYDGGSKTHTIALNTIGVKTDNAQNVSQAFNQNGDISANFNTATAGCNTKNKVTVASANNGRLLNAAPGSYDSQQFTAEIPYKLTTTFTAVTSGTGTGGEQHIGWAATTGGVASPAGTTYGAWRSSFDMDILAPAQSKGLVAGDYADTITVTLEAAA